MSRTTPEKIIVKHLQENGQTFTWLAGKIGRSVSHLHLVLKGKGKNKKPLTDVNKQKIAEALGITLN
jgi:hypothetical protein